MNECPDCGQPVNSEKWVAEEHDARCPQHDPRF